jgi:hypothetical protein
VATRVLDIGRRGRLSATLCAGLVSAGGCVSEPAPGVSAPTAGASFPQRGSVDVSDLQASMLAAALDDAARRTGVARADLRVVSAEAVTWPDGAIGCPQPGMMYTQALVPGYRVVLQAGAERLHYHAGRDGQPRFCPAGNVQPPAGVAEDR